MDTIDWQEVSEKKQRVIDSLGAIIRQLGDQVIADNEYYPDIQQAARDRLEATAVFLSSVVEHEPLTC